MSDQKLNPKFVLLAGILAAGLFAAVFAGTQMVQSAAAQNNSNDQEESQPKSTVTTLGTATTNVQPDRFTVTVGVEANGTTAQQAASSNADLIAQIIAALKELGVTDDQISTSSYSVFPVYGHMQSTEVCIMIYPPPPECLPEQEITGYRASNNISVTLDADGGIETGQVIDTAAEAGANAVSGAYYFISSEMQQEVRDELIADAIASARQRADIAAEAVRMEVSGIQPINLNDVYFPVLSRELAADTQILPGQQEVSMSVSVTYIVQES